VFSTINFIYLFTQNPYKNKKTNWIEKFNEFCILLCIHETNVLLDESIKQ